MNFIQEKTPELSKGLTKETYALYFHSLLFLEELSQVYLMNKMETIAPLIKRGQYFVFTFEEETIYHNLSPGDTVLLSNPWVEDESESPAIIRIWMRKDNEIFFNFKDVFNIIGTNGALFRMRFKNNRTCIVRTHHAIDFFLKRIGVQWLFPDVSFIKIHSEGYSTEINYLNQALNEEQRKAVRNIIFTNNNRSSPFLLFGPPGTGKTVTLVEAVCQVIQHYPESRILISAPSNSAVDTFCELLISKGLLNKKDLLRLTSFTYSQQEYSAILSTNISEEHSEIRYCDTDALTQFKVLAGTLSNLGILNCIECKYGHFTHIFVDEAGQTTEPETLIPIAGIQPGSTRVVFAGDPKQLGPVILNPVAKEYGLGDSFMLRLLLLPIYSRYTVKPKMATMLNKNYRSLPSLVNLFSNLFYNDNVVSTLSEDSREAQLLNNIQKVSSSLVVVKVNGQEVPSNCERNSYGNLMEAARVSIIVTDLYKAGLTSLQIGVITPYTFQVKCINECFSMLQVEPPKIGTVEEFQGSERDVIVLSLVRTNHDECRLSFIGDARRSNVALSRAKVMNVIVAKETTLRQSNIWERVLR
uniref:RNA helicase n=1 Tax=Rhodnius prolixus TaxID=13249 RepID=T1HW02_RHOPR